MASGIGRIGKLAPASSALFVCDIQERFRPLISGFPAVIDAAQRLVGKAGGVKASAGVPSLAP
jgi:hypothetical protein